MTYIAKEESAREGKPIELYVFTASEPDVDTIRLTSRTEDLTFDGDDYFAVPVNRSKPEQTGGFDVNTLTVDIATEQAIVQRFLGFVPSYSTWLTIYRFHEDDPDLESYVFWHGLVRGVTVNGAKSTLQGEPFLSVFKRLGLRRTYQNLCNHVLGDSGCQVDMEAFKITGTATLIDGMTITVPEAASFPDQWFRGGYIETVSHDRRLIIDQIGADLVVFVPFSESSFGLGDVGTIFAGCGHDFGTCKAKFNNARRFGGFPFVPNENFFSVGLR